MTTKVLVTTNPLNHEGGVVNYYRLFFKNFKSDDLILVHLPFGSRMEHFYSAWKKRFLYPFFYFCDFTTFLWRLASDRQIRIVQVSPSLIPVPLLRDALIVLGSKLLRRKVVVFYRGWKENTVYFLKCSPFIRWLFRFVYGRADVTVVLASRFKEDLVEMGWSPSSIEITTTMYDAKEIQPARHRSGERPRFLYLGRISHLKGMRELIDAGKILADRGIDFECVVVGHGDRKGVVEMYESLIRDYGIDNCFRFLGRLTGNEKYQVYSSSDIYVFPSWSEGCPNSVLEALGSGLFVVSTEVGALRDIIRNGENGKIVRCKDPMHLAETLVSVCKNIEEIRNKRQAIQKDAEAHFESKIIIKQFTKIYSRLIYDKFKDKS